METGKISKMQGEKNCRTVQKIRATKDAYVQSVGKIKEQEEVMKRTGLGKEWGLGQLCIINNVSQGQSGYYDLPGSRW